MPLYDYVCANGHRTEVMHGVYAAGPETCPVCGAAVRKAFVAPSVHFKGSGWAKMDRRSASGTRKQASDSASADSPSSESPSSESAPTTDPKPATTTEGSTTPAKASDAPASKSTSSATD